MNDKTLREAFIRRLTVDSENRDRRYRGFNQAIFIPAGEPGIGGAAVWTEVSLGMVMDAFDAAVRDVEQADKLTAKSMKRSMRKITDHR